jgi:hypothetical protein
MAGAPRDARSGAGIAVAAHRIDGGRFGEEACDRFHGRLR